jgi:hypothetical protein
VAKAGIVVVTGHKEIDDLFRKMPAALQRKFTRGALRLAAKRDQQETKRIIKSESYDTGAFYRSIKIKATKRSRVRIGVSVFTDRNKLFAEYEKQHGHKPHPRKGETEPHFYPASIEFGTDNEPAVKPMRRALYDNAGVYRAYFIGDLQKFIREQKVTTKLSKATGFGKLK